MCTLTYLPKTKGYIVTSNRDELVSRKKAIFPNYRTSKRGEIIFPKDGDAGGSWIAASNELVVCLLNGAYDLHERRNDYVLSRGLVLLEAFEYSNAEEFIEDFDFSGIEAFTMIFLDQLSDSITEFVWDEQDKFIKSLSSGSPHIWSSAPLYSEAERMEKKAMFLNYVKSNNNITVEDMKKFHKFEGDVSERPKFLLSRSDTINTVSITSVYREGREMKMEYQDMEN